MKIYTNKSKYSNELDKISLEIFKNDYPKLGAKEFCNKYNININHHSLRCLASRLGVKLNKIEFIKRIKLSRDKINKLEWGKKISESKTKYNYENIKLNILNDFEKYKSARKIAKINNLNEYAVKLHLKKWGVKLIRNINQYEFSKDEIHFLINNKDILSVSEFCICFNKSKKQIISLIKKLNIQRDWNNLRKINTIEFNLTDNPTKRYGVRKKLSEIMKRKILDNPETMLNRRLNRNKKTSIEKRVESILIKNQIPYEYNKYVKLKNCYKFPDFNIKNNLIIECDGSRFHSIEKDNVRDVLFIEEGYNILHFSDDMINKNIEEVERCILQKLKELNI